jgi:putative intracellular protease/amidase/ketosteroid isomerase-like protein
MKTKPDNRRAKAVTACALAVALASLGAGFASGASAPAAERPAPVSVLVLLGEWFGDAYFPLEAEIKARGWAMKRIGVDVEYRGCYNKKRDVLMRSEILIPDLKDFSGYDAVIIPSGPHYRKFVLNPVVLGFLKDAHAAGLIVASFCVGNFVVDASGLAGRALGEDRLPARATWIEDRILIGPRGGGPPPGDGFESAPVKEVCQAIAEKLAARTSRPAGANRAALSGLPGADERWPIAQALRECIGWAKNKDFRLLYDVIANDADFVEVHPDGEVVKGIEAFRKSEAVWKSPDFKAVRYEIRDLKITLAKSGGAAWFYCLLDDINEWKGKPANWENTRWTGVLEKRDGRWVIVQQHFSFAAKD